MKIAIWGMGKHGNKLLTLLLSALYEQYSVSCLVDQNIQKFEHLSVPQNVICITPDSLKECYDKQLFDAVIIGSSRSDYRQQMLSELKEMHIPIIEEQELMQEFFQLQITKEIEKHLVDQESRDLFHARLYMKTTGNERPFLETICRYQYGRKYVMWDLIEPMKQCGAKRVILFGDGQDASLNLSALRLCETNIAAVCVLNDLTIDFPFLTHERIIFADDLMNSEYDDCLVVISSKKNRDKIRNILSLMNYPKERIYDPPNRYRPVLAGFRLLQYFDVWTPRTHEVFVDCGTYDGQTLLNFYKWAKTYDTIYALEPLPLMQEKIREKIQALPGVKMFPVAAWDKNEELIFEVEENLSGSRVEVGGEKCSTNSIVVQGAALDSIIKERISFLKMDIEGSELAAINGAEELIKRWKPRLAISIYHKPEDVLEIPMRILEIVPEYQFCIRHYSAGLYETVLYASVEENVWIDA